MRKFLLTATVLCTWAIAALPAAAADPKPEDVLRKMADYLGNLPAMSCKMSSTVDISAGAFQKNIVTKYTMRLDKPKRFAMIVDEGELGMTMVSDGKQLIEYVPALGKYLIKDAPTDLAAMGSSPEASGMLMGVELSIPVTADEFYKQMMTGVSGSEYVGVEKVDGVDCQRVRFKQQEFDWDIWIEQGDKPVPRKIVPDFSKRFAQLANDGNAPKIDMTLLFSDWNLAPKFTDADFAFEPPAGAEKVAEFFSQMPGNVGPHPLLGKPAPPFTTVNLQNEPVDLEKFLGKNVVVLDFWATWCGPCVEAMPIISEVTSKFKDRGVVFYAVNLGDDADTIKEFLKARELDVPVAMDTDSAIGAKYEANAIPQTVLIGKDGMVQVVHVGFSDNLQAELTQQLEDLVAGKDLASAELAKADEKPAADTSTGPVEENGTSASPPQ